MHKGIVYLIGAGPGDPGLITVKGLNCLRRAEVVIYDYLANPVLLEEAPPEAERIYVGKTRGRHHLPQSEINALLIEKARQGRVVARLKGGDPYVFGRGGEEAEELQSAGVPFEVVPGISAGFAAAAYAGIPLTHRDYTTSLALITGHENPEKKVSSLDWEKLSTGVGTLVFYMGMSNLELIAEQLQAHGRSPDTPAAVIRWGTTPQQQTITGTLTDIVERVREADIKPPAIIVIGEVVELREKLRWFDNRPLFGRSVLVTRAIHQARELSALLCNAGAKVFCLPTLELGPPESWRELDDAIARLEETDLLILTSVNGVSAFFSRLTAAGLDSRALHGLKVVAVGPKTAAALTAHGLVADLVPADHRAEGVVALLRERGVEGQRILYPRSALSRDLICRELTAAGAFVSAPVAYRTLQPAVEAERLRQTLVETRIDAVTFTSSSAVDNFLALLDQADVSLSPDIAVASIGPLTTESVRRHGLKVAVEAKIATSEALLEALEEYFSSSSLLRTD
ncbi:MAG: uroporphyrinogen-III C-methyltransferase [Syntrophotaleaceae bacterium]